MEPVCLARVIEDPVLEPNRHHPVKCNDNNFNTPVMCETVSITSHRPVTAPSSLGTSNGDILKNNDVTVIKRPETLVWNNQKLERSSGAGATSNEYRKKISMVVGGDNISEIKVEKATVTEIPSPERATVKEVPTPGQLIVCLCLVACFDQNCCTLKIVHN